MSAVAPCTTVELTSTSLLPADVLQAVRQPLFALEQRAVYLSPSGRRCRLVARPWGGKATLLYDLADGSPQHSRFGDGFHLAQANWWMLRRVG